MQILKKYGNIARVFAFDHDRELLVVSKGSKDRMFCHAIHPSRTNIDAAMAMIRISPLFCFVLSLLSCIVGSDWLIPDAQPGCDPHMLFVSLLQICA